MKSLIADKTNQKTSKNSYTPLESMCSYQTSSSGEISNADGSGLHTISIVPCSGNLTLPAQRLANFWGWHHDIRDASSSQMLPEKEKTQTDFCWVLIFSEDLFGFFCGISKNALDLGCLKPFSADSAFPFFLAPFVLAFSFSDTEHTIIIGNHQSILDVRSILCRLATCANNSSNMAFFGIFPRRFWTINASGDW